jgi:hypothetical protein
MIALSAAYGLGHPALDAYRPAALDKPLHGFYFDVNATIGQCEHLAMKFDSARVMHYFGNVAGRMKDQLHK